MIILPAQLDGFRSLKDKTLKITFETQELTPAQTGEILAMTGSFCYLAIKPEHFKDVEKNVLSDLKAESYEFGGKSSSQRLRGVLFRLWQQDSEGFDSSVKHYEHHLEKIITHFKSKLP
jgi:hypothetical protein